MKSVKGWRRLGWCGGSGWGEWDGGQEWEMWRWICEGGCGLQGGSVGCKVGHG